MANPLEALDRRPYPRQMILDVHSHCNGRCLVCPYDSLKGRIPMGEMKEPLFRKIVDDFANLSALHGFTGRVLFCNMGEIFVHPEVLERVRYVVSSGLEFNIQTNASLLAPALTERLVGTGFRGSVLVSCHGISPDVYRKTMGLEISRTLANVDFILGHYPKERVVVQAIPYLWPRGESRRVRKHWGERGVKLRMPLPNNRAGLLPGVQDIRKTALTGCRPNRPLGEMVVCFNGDVILCCNDMAQREIVGNLTERSIQEVWNSGPFLRRIRQIYCGETSGDDFICKSCEFATTCHSGLRRLLRNAGYLAKRFYYTRIR